MLFWIKVSVMILTITAGIFAVSLNSSSVQNIDYRIDNNQTNIEIDL
jgi:hypothetical protein